jgi:hypothetical protein
MTVPPDLVDRLRQIFMAFPEVTERASHGAPTWFVRSSPQIATVWQDGHHEIEFPQLWCAAPEGAQRELIAAAPERHFRPPYVGHRGWIGVRLDGALDWSELAEVAEDGYRAVAPKSLVARLDAQRRG